MGRVGIVRRRQRCEVCRGRGSRLSRQQAVEDQRQGAVVQILHPRTQEELRLLSGRQQVENPQLGGETGREGKRSREDQDLDESGIYC